MLLYLMSQWLYKIYSFPPSHRRGEYVICLPLEPRTEAYALRILFSGKTHVYTSTPVHTYICKHACTCHYE